MPSQSDKAMPAPQDKVPGNDSPPAEDSEDDPTGLCAIVGIGASAGGLEAFTQMLKRLPTSTGMGFVLVQHLDPHKESMLTELLASHTAMPVQQAAQGTKVEPDHVYVIPPNTQMALRNGALVLTERTADRTPHLPIDFFLSSLAEDQKSRAIGVILSGTASDGSLGLEAIKAAGGITFAQDESATFDGMPRSAIAAGVVDFVLAPGAIAQEIAAVASQSAMKAPVENSPALHKILSLLQGRTGLTFAHYKRATISRRLLRRMAVHHLDDLEAYLGLLEQDSGEVDALFDDLLITVTEFFRDPTAFDALTEKAFPVMVRNRKQAEPIRVWVPGCASGKEVYSLAIALLEYLEETGQTFPIQIFGTDVSKRSIEAARWAIYPHTISSSMSPERLEHFFIKLEHGYQVKRSVREICVFSRQDITRDPPLSKMDLISCRNLLIYLGPVLQRRVLTVLNYALQPNGCLLLGTSETLGALSDHFIALDSKHKIYSRNLELARPSFEVPIRATVAKSFFAGSPVKLDDTTLLTHSADRLLSHQYAPSGFLVNSKQRIVKYRGEVEPYLATPGDSALDVFQIVHQDIATPLRSALDEAKDSDLIVRRDHVQIRRDDNLQEVNLVVVPMAAVVIDRHFLVLFEEGHQQSRQAQSSGSAPANNSVPGRDYRDLVLDLASTRSYMQRLVEELGGANEEAQSSNEELQSTNEELQTAKEELQSSNEELITTNEEMGSRNSELNQVNNDLVNLLRSLEIPIIMLDNQLRIRRYTPIAEKVLNMTSTDIGRAVSDLKPRINVPDLEELLAKVITSTQALEREVQDQGGCWYSLRIHPYKTAEGLVDGAVLQLVEIDQLKRSMEEVKHARDYAEAIIGTVREPLLVLNQKLRVQTANLAFFDTFEISAADTLNRTIRELDHGRWNHLKILGLFDGLLNDRTAAVHEIEIEQKFERIGWRTFQLSARHVYRNQGTGLILLALVDVSDRKKAAEAKYRRLFETAKDGMIIVDADSGEVTDVNPYLIELSGVSRTEFIGKEIWETKPLWELKDRRSTLDRLRKEEFVRFPDLSMETSDGRRVELEAVANLYKEGERWVAQFNIRDVTERKHLDEKLQQTARLESLGILAGGIAHDFNNLLSGILGNAGLALGDAPADTPYQNALKDVIHASQRAADLTRQMLAYSGKGHFVVRPMYLSELVMEVSTLVRSSIPRSVELVFDLAEHLLPIEADSSQMQQVIMNLIINGAEAVGEGTRGRVTITTKVERPNAEFLRTNYPADALSPAAYVVLQVTDTGSGMDENIKARIFDPFFTTKFTGRGLGLASVQGIVRGHHGAIRVQSAVGQGTTFTLLFPAVQVPVEKPKPKEKLTPDNLRGTGLVLVVDDEEIATCTMRAILERNGYQVLTAANGEIGVRMVREHKDKLALVILDLTMPVMGGEETFAQMHELASDLPVILTSGYDVGEAMTKFRNNALAGFIQKPATVADLLGTVKTALEDHSDRLHRSDAA